MTTPSRRAAVTVLFALVATLASTSAASAAAPEGDAPARLRAAIERPAYDVYDQRVVLTRYGRSDLVLFASVSADDIAEDLQRTYRRARRLPGGFQVAGWAHTAETDTWTFTLTRGDAHHVAEISPTPDGSRIALWGAATVTTRTASRLRRERDQTS